MNASKILSHLKYCIQAKLWLLSQKSGEASFGPHSSSSHTYPSLAKQELLHLPLSWFAVSGNHKPPWAQGQKLFKYKDRATEDILPEVLNAVENI